ncbi:DUF4298 domain-containing protein [Coriobacteriales bacterium OH1046]|nr:DUF4298 domain-containing protein [Coriobacteriales bacterium OH1046]
MEESVERIGIAEEAFDRVVAASRQLEASLDAFDDILDDLTLLADYYGSSEWFEDRGADEKNKLPKDLKRGVLSEDLPYDMLSDARGLALRMLEIATDVLYLV